MNKSLVLAAVVAAFALAACGKKEEPAPVPAPVVVTPAPAPMVDSAATAASGVDMAASSPMDAASPVTK